MLSFPHGKINIGLQITGKRPDGYHDISSVFYPLKLNDILEVQEETDGNESRASFSGIPVPGKPADNLCLKAYDLIRKDYPLPSIRMHLHKHIPIGAGLGGGSSDAAFFIRLLNDKFGIGLSWGEMHHYARQLGSDCSFFISGRTAHVTGRGEEMETMDFSLKGYYLLLVCPPVHISTAQAYAGVIPQKSAVDLETFIPEKKIGEWKDSVKNDFEPGAFSQYPVLAGIKSQLYDLGALYASMSGSGSALYGIFPGPVSVKGLFENCLVWTELF